MGHSTVASTVSASVVRRDPEPGRVRRRPAAVDAARLVARDVVERPVVHEARHQQLRPGFVVAARWRDGGGREVAAPAVLDREAQPELAARGRASASPCVSPPTRPSLRLIASHAGRARSSAWTSVMTSSSTIGSVVRSRTIRHSSSVGQGCSKSTRSRPFERARGDRRVLQAPAAVGVGDDHVAVLGRLQHRPHAGRVLARVGAELELEAPDALRPARAHVRDHLVDRAERDRDVEREVVARAPPSSVLTGRPAAWPSRSQQAMSTAAFA